jgi:hypothetical protein
VEGAFGSYVNGGDVQVVAVGVGFAGEHLGYDHVLQAAFDAFYFFYVFDFETREGEEVVEFMGCEVGVDILTEPFI